MFHSFLYVYKRVTAITRAISVPSSTPKKPLLSPQQSGRNCPSRGTRKTWDPQTPEHQDSSRVKCHKWSDYVIIYQQIITNIYHL